MKMAQQAAKQPPPKKPSLSSDDDRPILKRPGSSGASSGDSNGSSTSSGASANTPPSSDDNDPDRPTLKSSSSTASSQPPAAAPAQAKSQPPPKDSTEQANDQDPGRPTLRRGQQSIPSGDSQPSASASAKAPVAPSPAEQSQNKLMATMASFGRGSYPAVSDAGSYETRSLLYAMSPTERQDKSQQMTALAMEDIQKFISQRKSPALPKGVTITDYDLRAYDLDFSNSPTLVLTAALPVQGVKALRTGEFDYYVTIVAREDINGQPIKIFSSVTDSNHLDAFSRMEIIDAVDADANGRGDLLFREHSDIGISYSLYRVFPYQMQRVFEGGSGI
jgi:hypothetical protein